MSGAVNSDVEIIVLSNKIFMFLFISWREKHQYGTACSKIGVFGLLGMECKVKM